MTIGARLKQFRNLKGLTQVKLATNAGISRSYLADVEANRYNPSLSTLTDLVRVLGIAVSCLLDDQGVAPIGSWHIPTEIAAHFENTEFKKEEVKEIDHFINFLTSRRKKQQPKHL